MYVLLAVTFAVFAALALFAPAAVQALTTRHRLRRPRRALLLVFRVWFAVLALATVALLFAQLRTPR